MPAFTLSSTFMNHFDMTAATNSHRRVVVICEAANHSAACVFERLDSYEQYPAATQ
jgi:hypothetical protein